MRVFIDTKPDINVQASEYNRLLGYPHDYKLSGKARELADGARQWYQNNGKPWIYGRQTDEIELRAGELNVEGITLSSKRLYRQFKEAQVQTVMLVVVSAGQECEAETHRLWEQEKPDEYFFLEVYGSAVVEHLITITGAGFCAWADEHGMAVLPHYSPGYSEWTVSDQHRLLDLIQSNQENRFPGKIDVLESGMLKPKKSLLALFGITTQAERVRHLTELNPCERCSFPACLYRRTPYKYPYTQMEDVRRFSTPRNGPTNTIAVNRPALNRNARYSVGIRALRKWSQERLRLTFLPDGSIEAGFRYEGTTCANLGHRLEYDYTIKLSSADKGYVIRELDCRPAPEDTGHQYMCEYMNNAKALVGAIEEEKPLIGRPLNDILDWQREPSPAGCYCESAGRLHKWGLILEVIHYALVQHDRKTASGETE